MAPKLLTDLPADMVQHIVVRLTLAHHIARAAPTCHVVSVAARNAIKETSNLSQRAQAFARCGRGDTTFSSLHFFSHQFS